MKTTLADLYFQRFCSLPGTLFRINVELVRLFLFLKKKMIAQFLIVSHAANWTGEFMLFPEAPTSSCFLEGGRGGTEVLQKNQRQQELGAFRALAPVMSLDLQ